MSRLASPPAPTRALSGPLPREARDTLFLLAVLAWTLLPQLARVPTWCAAFALGALAWRALLAWRGARLPPGWLRLLLLLALVGLAAQSYRSLLGKEAGVALLVALAGLKTLELQARRDVAVVFGLGLFLVLANFLYSQSLGTALVMAVAVTGLLTALVLVQMRGGRPSIAAALRVVTRHALVGAPLVALLFLLFPRIAPLWGVPGEAGGRTGLSDQLELGSVAELASDDALALRVRFTGAVPPAEQIYFRGPVLNRVDMTGAAGPARPSWRSAARPPAGLASGAELQPLRLTVTGTPVDYEMTLEPLRVTTLPLLELSAEPPALDEAALAALPGLQQQDDLQWVSARPLAERVRLTARAWPAWRVDGAGPTPRGGPTGADLALPDGVYPRTRAWALTLVGKVQASLAAPAAPTSAAGGQAAASAPPLATPLSAPRSAIGLAADGYAVALLAHIRHGGYVYTLAPGLAPPGVDALDHFWLDHQQGFCEHYAVAFVVALRALGVPARVVTGYQGGHVNPVDGVFEVRQSDAHAWAEYWRDGSWARVDPTAAVAPERVRLAARLRPPPGLVAGTLGRFDPGVAAQIARLRELWSAADHRWNQWVLDHDRQRQLDLLRRLGWAEVDTLDLARVLLITLAGVGLAGAVWAGWDGRRSVARPRRDAWLAAWAPLQAVLRDVAGLTLLPQATPAAAARAARARWGEAAQGLVTALLALERLRYAAQADASGSAAGPGPAMPGLLPLQRRLRTELAGLALPPGTGLGRLPNALRRRLYARTGIRLGW